MEILRIVLVILHLIGMAMIVGGYLANIKSPRIIPGMLHASYLQLATGLLLVMLAEMNDAVEVNHVKIGIKLLLALLVTVFAFIGNRKQKQVGQVEGAQPSAALAHLTGAAAILAVIVAVAV